MPAPKGGQSVSERCGFAPLEVAPSELLNKKASESEIVRWVARNVDNPSPDPLECPDPFAWTLLRECRETPGFTAMFLEKLWVKLIPPRSAMDQNDVGKVDGKATLETIDRILAAKEAAEASVAEALASRKPPMRDAWAEATEEA